MVGRPVREDELLEALKLLAQSGKIGLIIVTYPRHGEWILCMSCILGDKPAQDDGGGCSGLELRPYIEDGAE